MLDHEAAVQGAQADAAQRWADQNGPEEDVLGWKLYWFFC